jgi:hypothetical protein
MQAALFIRNLYSTNKSRHMSLTIASPAATANTMPWSAVAHMSADRAGAWVNSPRDGFL